MGLSRTEGQNGELLIFVLMPPCKTWPSLGKSVCINWLKHKNSSGWNKQKIQFGFGARATFLCSSPLSSVARPSSGKKANAAALAAAGAQNEFATKLAACANINRVKAEL